MQQPIDFHCHGIGKYDFVNPSEIELGCLNERLEIEGIKSVLTLYLPKSKLDNFIDFVLDFHEGKMNGKYQQIVGIALEGPLLASFGGTPEMGCWQPNCAQWQKIASLGKYGLLYVVISPDADPKPNDIEIHEGDLFPQSVNWIAKTLCKNGVMPALGHFKKDNPELSAKKIKDLCNELCKEGFGPIITDHLFNDMPLNFHHCWRTREEKKNKHIELKEILDCHWDLDNIEITLGAVPAAIIKQALQGNIKICMNFDGDHVDLAICKKTVELIGSKHLLLMTDRIQSKVLGGQNLSSRNDNTLLYQEKGIVAGGTQSILRQIKNMLEIGISQTDILNISTLNANYLLNKNQYTLKTTASPIDELTTTPLT